MKTMKKMRKFLSLVLTAALALSLFAGCSEKITDDKAAELFEKGMNITDLYSNLEAEEAAKKLLGDDLEIDYESSLNLNGGIYYETNFKYLKAVDNFSAIFTGDLYDKFMNLYFHDEDGILYVRGGGGGIAGGKIENIEVTYIDDNGDELNYNAIFDSVFYSIDDGSPVETHEGSIDFSLKKVGGSYKLSKFPPLSGFIDMISAYDAEENSFEENNSDEENKTDEENNTGEENQTTVSADTRPSDEDVKRIYTIGDNVLWSYLADEPSSAAHRDFGDDIEIDYNYTVKFGGVSYYRTNLKYSDAEEKYSEIFGGDLYDKFMAAYFYNDNGTLCVRMYGGMSGMSFEVVNVTFTGCEGNEYNYKVKYNSLYDYTDENGEEKVGYTPHETTCSVIVTDGGVRLSGSNLEANLDLEPYRE